MHMHICLKLNAHTQHVGSKCALYLYVSLFIHVSLSIIPFLARIDTHTIYPIYVKTTILSWVCEESGWTHKQVPKDLLKAAEEVCACVCALCACNLKFTFVLLPPPAFSWPRLFLFLVERLH